MCAETCRGQAGSRASCDGQPHILYVEGCNCTDNNSLTRALEIMGQVTCVKVMMICESTLKTDSQGNVL